MYSKRVLAALKKAKAGVGSRVAVSKGNAVFEGVILPQVEHGDSGTLVLKLDSGYNAGIALSSGVRIEAVKGAVKTVLEKKEKTRFKRLDRELALISSGGTISSRVDYATGGVKMVLTPEELFSVVPELEGVASFSSITSPFTVASEDISPAEWVTLAKLAAKELNSDAEGVIVTHGTDTLGYTAAALAFMLGPLNKPLALVGAQRSPDRASFDGALNLVCASRYCYGSIAEPAVVMHATSSDDYCDALPATKTRKMHSTRRDAFKAINSSPLAMVWPDGRIERKTDGLATRNESKIVPKAVFERKTALLKIHPGASPDLLDYFVSRKFKGVVLEGTGMGHVPTETLSKNDSWIPAVKRAVDSGVKVVAASQCVFGSTGPYVYKNLRALNLAGAMHCRDMLAETAYVKLGWVLAQEKKEERVWALFNRNVAREFNDRITDDLYF